MLRKRDRLIRADVLAGAALGAVVGTSQHSHILEIERARRALVDADTAGCAEIGIDNRLAHALIPFDLPRGTRPPFRFAP